MNFTPEMKKPGYAFIREVSYEVSQCPLFSPYKLSYRILEAYDSFLVHLDLNNGKRLTGEVTPLVGYTEETIESIVAQFPDFRQLILGQTVSEAIAALENAVNAQNCFALSAFIPPLENYLYPEKLPVVQNRDLIYALDCDPDDQKLAAQMEQVAGQGFLEVKVKLGRDSQSDLRTIERLSGVDLHGLKIRFDANSGYDLKTASEVLGKMKILGDSAEYLEQPLCRKCWDEMAVLVKEHPDADIMIDESIYEIGDIARAAQTGARFIKLKLCKFGSLSLLQQALDYAKSLGLNVVFGNGVATDISNYFELLFFFNNRDKIFGAAESVGFQKISKRYFDSIQTI